MSLGAESAAGPGGERTLRGLVVPMRDGVGLAMDVRLPAGD